VTDPPGLEAVLAEERRIMNLLAPSYREWVVTNSYVYRRERRLFADWIASALRAAGRDLAALRVLDVGCGTGEMVELLHGLGVRQLAGIDLSDGMLREARARAPAARWIEGALEHHDFAGESFDVAVAALTVHHLFDPRAFFALVDRLVEPGGWFFLLEYDAGARTLRGPAARALGFAMSPARVLLGWKNRRALGARAQAPRLFNPAHRLLALEDLRAAMPRPDAWQIARRKHGTLLTQLSDFLVEESRLDRGLVALLEGAERLARPLAPGDFQWIAGRRTAEPADSGD
jgi:2-polyprenyl-3-methyl-5-hydroxy-6-metoxy-1,4-benzoquinol methylase